MVAGVLWACSFEDEGSLSSMFSPEAFVSKEYTPFFYDSQYWYYGGNVEIDDNNNRFNEQVIGDWDNYLNHQLNRSALRYLLFQSKEAETKIVKDYINGKTSSLKPDSLHINPEKLNKNKITAFFEYLKLAKDCEKFAVSEGRSWYDDPKTFPEVPPAIESSLSAAFKNSNDNFIKQRLWFQLIRYYYFYDDTSRSKAKSIHNAGKIVLLFDKYKNVFPQNLTYYRAQGYLAGYYRRKGNYALSNYLYSRCYDFSFEMKIPSKFSFRAQEESDWYETLKLAKNKQEKITLWHMLGMEYDPLRAIKEIVALDPKSDKIDLLLSRLVNTRELDDPRNYFYSGQQTFEFSSTEKDKIKNREISLIDSIAQKNNTAKPYFWNIAAGYLNYMQSKYAQADKFYAQAKKQLPANDKLIMAQYKMLSIFLNVQRIKRIDTKTEVKLIEPLNWLKDLQEGKNNIKYLRIGNCADVISRIFLRQGDSLKAHCFNDTVLHYSDSIWVQRLVNLMNKPNKSPFEKTMLRYYPHNLDELYYHQALMLTYNNKVEKALELMSKAKFTDRHVSENKDTLYGNPFNSRLNDCHDCDHTAPQKQKFTPLTFLKTLASAKNELKEGKNKFRNAWLLANAYYNISYFGNARLFYELDSFNGIDSRSQELPLKYYLLARTFAQTNEQKARCTFMASKCEHNIYYNEHPDSFWTGGEEIVVPPSGNYFEELKQNYAKTKYYQEVLRECGYFREYVNSDTTKNK